MNWTFFLHVLLSITGLAKASIGQGFFLHNHDLYTDYNGGYPVFSTLPTSCIIEVNQSLTMETKNFYHDTETFFSSISTTTGISAELKGEYTMGATLNTKSASLYGTSKELKGYSLDIFTTTAYSVLSQKCLQTETLAPQILFDFERLPAKISNPNETSSWVAYKNFLQTYGSHVVSEVHYGSRMRQWAFSLSTTSYKENDFELRACLEFEGFTQAGKLNVSACGGFTTQEIQSAAHFDMRQSLELRGGQDNTRNSLRIQRTNELITQFLNEGRQFKTAIDYRWVAIWDILQIQSSKDDDHNFARALNLQQYYEGMLDFGCSPVKSGDVMLRWFESTSASTEDVPEYQCKLRKNGCSNNDDCHLGGAGSVCYCYGPSCVQWTDPPKGAKAGSAEIRSDKQGSYDEGINNSCYYKFIAHCNCHGDWSTDKRIWPKSTSHVLAILRGARVKNSSTALQPVYTLCINIALLVTTSRMF